MIKKKISFFEISWTIFIFFSSWLMLNIVLPYTSFKLDIDFLKTKQSIIHLFSYRSAFYIHIFSSLVVMITGGFLFSKYILKNYSWIHRALGKAYVYLVLCLAAPSGLFMSFYANGGILNKIAFIILSCLWWAFTFFGVKHILNKNVAAHKRWMIRSYALSLSAITLRLSQWLLSGTFSLDPQTQYLIVSWSSWIINLIIAETIIYYPWKSIVRINTKSKIWEFS